MPQLQNPHPGVILGREFLDEIGMSLNQLAEAIGVSGDRLRSIINGTGDITSETGFATMRAFRPFGRVIPAAPRCL